MSSACPSVTFSCSNISCSIWFCCGGGGSNKEPEQDSIKEYQQGPHPQPLPPPPQVITVPDHLKPTSGQQPPELPPAPPGQQINNPPHHVPSIETHYQPPSPSTQQQTWPQTLLPLGLPKVHDPWSPCTQTIPSDVQPTMMHKPPLQPALVRSQAPPPPQAPWPAPARQPSKTYQQLAPPPEQQRRAPPPHPFKTYQAEAPPQALPPGPLVDSMPFMGYYPHEHPEYTLSKEAKNSANCM